MFDVIPAKAGIGIGIHEKQKPVPDQVGDDNAIQHKKAPHYCRAFRFIFNSI
jgi:hypothetical protein